jgi:hypothetical protein
MLAKLLLSKARCRHDFDGLGNVSFFFKMIQLKLMEHHASLDHCSRNCTNYDCWSCVSGVVLLTSASLCDFATIEAMEL